MPNVNLMWRKVVDGKPVQTGPTMLIHHRAGVGVLLQVEVQGAGGAHPVNLAAHEEGGWLARIARAVGWSSPDLYFEAAQEGAGDGRSRTFVSAGNPWLPAPDKIPGQTHWRFGYGNFESGRLTVTTADLVTGKWGVEVALKPAIEAKAGAADVTVTAGSAVIYTGVTTIHALDDPKLSFDLLLPWSWNGSETLADVVKQYWNSLPDGGREKDGALEARMRAAGIIADPLQGWEIYLKDPPPVLDAGEDAALTLIAVSTRAGRVLAAVKVTNLDTGASIVTDLLEIVRE